MAGNGLDRSTQNLARSFRRRDPNPQLENPPSPQISPKRNSARSCCQHEINADRSQRLAHSAADIDTHMAYTAQQHVDGYSEAVRHALNRKAAFDRKVLKKGGVNTFERGQLVQTYRNDLANTLSTARKLQPMWTGPWRVAECMLNSYKLETLEGKPLNGDFNARRLRNSYHEMALNSLRNKRNSRWNWQRRPNFKTTPKKPQTRNRMKSSTKLK